MRLLLLCGSLTLAAPAFAQSVAAPTALPHPDKDGDDDGDDKPAAPAATAGPDIVVTARRLDHARDSIQASIGANDYRLTREALDLQPGGADTGMQAVLLQAPGVAQDSDGDGEIHIRNEHGNVQYTLNGVTVPDTFSGFGPLVDSRIAKSVEVLTGALPAQYGYRTAGIVQLKTQTGAFDLDGDVGVYGGGNGAFEPSATVRDSIGRLNFFVSGSYLENDLGIPNTTSSTSAIHDHTQQERGFGYLSYLIDEKSRLSLFGGTSIGSFQIPNTPGVTPSYVLAGTAPTPSAQLDQNQKQQTHFGVLSYQYSGDRLDFQISPFIRWAHAHYTPDPSGGELIYNGIDTNLDQTSLATGVQADASYKAGDAHTIRFGFYYQNEHNTTNSLNRVFAASFDPLSETYTQTGFTPITIPVSQSATANTFGVYVQDEWKIAPTLTFNYGLRYDRFSWELTEDQLSPRAGLVWKPATGTTIHAGYARYFTPPPLLEIGTGALTAFQGTTGAAEVLTADPVHAEREHQFDIGAQQIVAKHLTLGIDMYFKLKTNLLDDTLYGSTQLLAPFNYAKSYSWGVELSASYERGPIETYVNVARGQQKARQIVSNQFFFSAAELAYIAQNYIYTDHSQNWTVSGGGAFKIKDPLGQFQPGFDLIYGSGLRKDFANTGTQNPYVQVNLGIAQVLGSDTEKAVTLRVDVTNLFDKVYLLHDGSGVGAGQPEYGPRRAVMFGIRKAF